MIQSQSLSHKQSGIALITVLLFLILITIAGAIAVRQGLVDLNVATSDQAGTLMLNASDSILAHVEEAGGNTSSTYYKRIMSQNNGILGYFMVDGKNKIGHQLEFCYQPNSQFLYYRTQNTTIRLPGSGTQGGTSGLCQPSNAAHYTSSRGTAMTQMVIQGVENVLTDNYENTTTGVSSGVNSETYIPQVQIQSIAILPAMSNVADSVITGCLNRPIGDATQYGVNDGNITDCLKTNGVPANAVVEEGVLVSENTGGFSESTGVTSCNTAACRTNAGLQ